MSLIYLMSKDDIFVEAPCRIVVSRLAQLEPPISHSLNHTVHSDWIHLK
jgi:hypothetical protein